MTQAGAIDMAQLGAWKGRQEIATDVITPVPVAGMAATLDRDDPAPRAGDPLPPLWHWLYFLPLRRQSEIGPDGHPKRGGFMPPVDLPRRMFAGARYTFGPPLRVGDTVTRVSTIADVTAKDGRTGPLVFVQVRHEIASSSGGAMSEVQDIVFRDMPGPGDPAPAKKPAPANAVWKRTITPDDVFLFRYSALTFNGHRIHYDRRYATGVEGYPGLVVHGPLIASLIIELARANETRAMTSFSFRAVSPLFDIAPFTVCGAPGADGRVKLWAQDSDGALAMDAEASFA